MVAREHVADFVRDDAGELVLVAGDVEDAGIDADLATGERERVGCRIDEHCAVPLLLGAGRQLPGDRVDDAAHVRGLARIARLRQLLLVLGERLGAHLVELLLRHRSHRLGAAGGRGRGGAGGESQRDGEPKERVLHEGVFRLCVSVSCSRARMNKPSIRPAPDGCTRATAPLQRLSR